jgi:hypothetical protein
MDMKAVINGYREAVRPTTISYLRNTRTIINTTSDQKSQTNP